MSDDSESDCVACEEPDFECDRCGVGFCLEHASQHTEECDQFRKGPLAESGARPSAGEDPK